MRVEHGNKVSPIPVVSAAGDPRGHLGGIGEGGAIHVMVQIMELTDAGEPGLEHLGEGLRGDGLYVVRREQADENGTSVRATTTKLSPVGPRTSVRPAMAR